jgi:hypothetical protein
MARQSIIIDGIAYATKAAVQRRAKEILASGTIDLAAERFLVGLFERHPSAAEKIGPGIAAIRVVTVPPWNTRCFQIERVDGTTTDISYLECLRPTGPHQWFRAACRTAVRDQIEAARRAAFMGVDDIRCPVTGDAVTVFEGHVDHAPPWTFEAIVADFLVKTGLDPAALAYEDGDNVVAARFVDRYLEEEFAELHRQIAVLRVVSVRANLSVLRKAGA